MSKILESGQGGADFLQHLVFIYHTHFLKFSVIALVERKLEGISQQEVKRNIEFL